MPYTRLSRLVICLTLFLGACETYGPDRNLRYAADVSEAQQAVADGAQVNKTDPVGQTPLIIQARQGHLPVVRYLIDHGAKLDMVDGTGGSALSEAYRAGNKPVVDLLLDSGAYPTIMVNNRYVTLATDGLKAKAVTDAYAEARRGGCLGRSLEVCVRNLHAAFGFDVASHGNLAGSGSPLEIAGTFTKLDGSTSNETAHIRYGVDKTVQGVSMTLPRDPEGANTPETYDATGLYEAFVILLGTDCPAITKDQVYKFFQDQVKPKLAGGASGLSFCGRKFSFGRTGATADIAFE